MNGSHAQLDNEVYRSLYLASPVAGYVCDRSGFVIAYNEAVSTLWGRKPACNKDKWSGAIAHYYPDGRPMPITETPMAGAMESGGVAASEEVVIERPDGSRRTALVFTQSIPGGSSWTGGIQVTLVDVTDYRQNEEKQAMLSEIVRSTDDAIVSKTLDGIILSWNLGAERLFGYREAEVLGKSIETLIPAYLKSEEGIIISEIKAGNQVSHYQTIRLTKSGQEIPISLTISPIRNKHGRIVGASKIARDISDKIQREQTIQFHAQKLETLHAIGKVISEKSDTPSLIQTVIDSTTHLAAADAGLCCYRIADEHGQSKLSIALATNAEGSKEDYAVTQVEDGLIHAIFSEEGVLRFKDIGEVPHVLSLFKTKDDTDLAAIKHCLAIPIRAADGLLIGAMFFGYAQSGVFDAADEAMMRNIASLVAVTLDNARLFEEVNALNLKKNEFIALASHELKTPLTTVKGYLQILERSQIDQVGRRFLAKALKQLERINSLISELLDISKIEAGKLSFHFETFDMAELVLDVVETFHFSSQTHTVFVNNTRGDYVVVADRQRMEQVCINLITNAIKYSPDANNVQVLLESSSTEVSVQVKDEGVGLSRDQQEHIFTRFYQVEGTTKMAGLGLGLYLSKEIVKRHGGHIGVTSEVGKGSTFYFTIPRKQIG